MATALSVFIFGLSYGLILFLLATGLTLTMGLMRVINMAHGALYMVGGYLGLYVFTHYHNFWLSLVAAAVCTGVIGALLERGFLRRLYKQEGSQVLLTIGFIYIIMNATQWIFGAYPKGSAIPHILSGNVYLGSHVIPAYRLFLIAFGLLMAVLLWLFQDKTRVGAMVRAGMDNREIAGALGINLGLVFAFIFALGSLVAGMCGLLGAPVKGMSLGAAWDALLLSLIVVVIGGTGSIQGALLGGVIIGLLDAFGRVYFQQVAPFVVYGALVVILLVRPSGLLGRKMQTVAGGEDLEKASVRKRKEPHGVARALPDARGEVGLQGLLRRGVPYAAALVFLAVLAPFVGTYAQSTLTEVLIFALFAMSLDLTMGYVGLVSFGHAAFLGTAGYVIGVMTVHYHITSFWIVAPAALAITAVMSAVIGYICLRATGPYYLLVTMAFGQLLSVVAVQWGSLTGGRDGLPNIQMPDLGFHVGWTALRFYYFVLIGFVICYYILHRFVKSSWGKCLRGIGENEPRMRSLGYNTWALKYVAVIIGGIFAGVAGILLAYEYGHMVPNYLALETSALPMLMVIMGGEATLWGPCLGAVVIILAYKYSLVYLPGRWQFLLGVLFVLCVMLLKGGFASYLSRLWGVITLRRPAAAEVPTAAEVPSAVEAPGSLEGKAES